jgi:hypothetical protein
MVFQRRRKKKKRERKKKWIKDRRNKREKVRNVKETNLLKQLERKERD